MDEINQQQSQLGSSPDNQFNQKTFVNYEASGNTGLMTANGYAEYMLNSTAINADSVQLNDLHSYGANLGSHENISR